MRSRAKVSPLAPFNVALLESDPATICALDDDLRITWVNRAWRDFGQSNGAPWSDDRWTGACILDSVPAVIRSFYVRLFDEARASEAPVEHSYECSSATSFRRFRMRVLRCAAGGLLVVHSLSEEHAETRPEGAALEALYRDAHGLITQCAHCRRVRRGSDPAREWTWVPAWVAHVPPRTSHGICPICEHYFFPQ